MRTALADGTGSSFPSFGSDTLDPPRSLTVRTQDQMPSFDTMIRSPSGSSYSTLDGARRTMVTAGAGGGRGGGGGGEGGGGVGTRVGITGGSGS